MDHAQFPATPSLDDRGPARGSACGRGPTAGVDALWDDLRRLSYELELASPDARRTGESVLSVVLCGAVAGALMTTAWLGLAVAVAMRLVDR